MLKKVALFYSLVFGCVTALQGQVEVSLEFKKEFYLAHERLLAEVKIVNFSGKTLTFGQTKDWLQFTVESRNEFPVEKMEDLDIVEAFKIPNASRGIRRVHLVPAYKIVMPGRYRVTAYVNIPELNIRQATTPVEIGILSAAEVWHREIGVVTDQENTKAPIDIRRFSLIRAVNKKEIDLYVKVTDKYQKHIYGVYSLGNIVSFGQPEKQLDRLGNLHVLMQNGARSFRYTIIKPDSKTLLRQRWDYARTRPQLSMDQDGLIQVTGGLRRPSYDDIPTPEEMNEVRAKQLEKTAFVDQGGETSAEGIGEVKK